VTEAVRERVERETAAAVSTSLDAAPLASERAAALPVYAVNVQIHVIHGRHKHERALKKRGARRKVFQILRNAYNGGQSTASAPMGIDFRLRRISITQNDRWYHARPMSRADRQMKRRLHRGTAHTLNIYVNKPPNVGGSILLGYSRFPWQYRHHKKLDGVTISVRSLPGGNARGYNLGDSVVHETGHWLGLLHTFQGGCDNKDWVADTPAEGEPSYQCEQGRNTCPVAFDPVTQKFVVVDDGAPDPIHNFMDYSYDSCMFMFTPGQRQRVDQMFATYRAGR
jgi:hypothetical protein